MNTILRESKDTVKFLIESERISSRHGLKGIKVRNLGGRESAMLLRALANLDVSLNDLEMLIGNNFGYFNNMSIVFTKCHRPMTLSEYVIEPNEIRMYKPHFNSLAHEAFHAIDNHVLDAVNFNQPAFLTRTLYAMSTMPEYAEAADKCAKEFTGFSMKELKAMFKGMFERSLYTDARIDRRAYWTRPEEMAARAFEAYAKTEFPDNEMLVGEIEEDRIFYPTQEEMKPLIKAALNFLEKAEEILDSEYVPYLSELSEEDKETIEKQAYFVGRHDYIKQFQLQQELKQRKNKEEHYER